MSTQTDDNVLCILSVLNSSSNTLNAQNWVDFDRILMFFYQEEAFNLKVIQTHYLFKGKTFNLAFFLCIPLTVFFFTFNK